MGQLIKPDTFSVDIGIFTVEKAYEAEKWSRSADRQGPVREEVGGGARGAGLVPEAPACFASSSASNRDPPLSPEAAEAMLRTKVCTNGSDTQRCVDLYREAATALLGSTRELRYDSLEWKEAQFERLGEALCYCGALETLEVRSMDLSDTAAASVVAGLASCTSLQLLNLDECRSLTALPDLSALTSLHTLDLQSCRSLTVLPDLSALTSLRTLYLGGCESLTALHDLSCLANLRVIGLPRDLQAWGDGGRKSFSVPFRFQPGTRVRLTGLPDERAHLTGRCGIVVRAIASEYLINLDEALDDGQCEPGFMPGYLEPESWPLDCTAINLSEYRCATRSEWLSRCMSVQMLLLEGCESLTALPDLSALTTLKTLNLAYCSSLTALPDLSALKSLKMLDLYDCSSLTALPDLSVLKSLKTLNLDGCRFLTALPDLLALTSLQTLNLQLCESLTALPDLSALKSLQALDLRSCSSLTPLPDLSALTSLQKLGVGCESLMALPDLSALKSLRALWIDGCKITALPSLSSLTSLRVLWLDGCKSLRVLPKLGALTSLHTVDLFNCSSLTSLPDLSACKNLKLEGLPNHVLTPWKANGYKAYDSKLWEASDGWPLDSTVIDLSGYSGATLGVAVAVLERADALSLNGCSSLTALPNLSALTSLQTLNLERCECLTALPDLSALTALKVQDLPDHLKPWKANGLKALDFTKSTVIDLSHYGGATLPEWLLQCLLSRRCDLSALTSLQLLDLNGCRRSTSVNLPTALPDAV